ncbi:MAG: prenyltransferase/squalene oxidase repeat-containing protein [Acidimicrobiales bacterium]
MRPADFYGHASAGPAESPAAYRYLRRKLTRLVLARVDDAGAIRDPCGSRTLESALLLRLLDRCHASPPGRDALVSYLTAQRLAKEHIDRVLAGCALGLSADARCVASEIAIRSPRPIRGRKQLLATCLLALLDPSRTPPPATRSPEDPATLHSWASLEMVALHAIAVGAGVMEGPTGDRDWRRLLASQDDDNWDGNLLVHILALHALAYRPSCAAVIAAGVTKALRHQRPDGGIPFVPDVDVYCTATAGLALICSRGATPAQLAPLGNFVADQQRSDSLWPYSELSVQTDLDDSSICLQFLQLLNPKKFVSIIAKGLEAVAHLQGGDGGFPTYVKGAPSEAYITAAAINALSLGGPRYWRPMANAMGYLVASQLPDGTFDADWSRSRLHPVFRALLAVSRFPPGHLAAQVRAMQDRAVGAVVDAHNPDGGWGQEPGYASDATSTAYAVMALAALGQRRLVPGALRYLRQAFIAPDAGMSAPPDMVGPRPFPIDVPILPNLYTLLALGHLQPPPPPLRSGI